MFLTPVRPGMSNGRMTGGSNTMNMIKTGGYSDFILRIYSDGTQDRCPRSPARRHIRFGIFLQRIRGSRNGCVLSI